LTILNKEFNLIGETADNIPAVAPPNKQRKELKPSNPIVKNKGITKGKKWIYSSYQNKKVLIREAEIVSKTITQFLLFFHFSWREEAKKSCIALLSKRA
jgi:hypothetical protein